MTPVHTLYADTVDGPAETHERRRDLALAYHHASTRSDHGPILLQIHESIESPPGLLILSGWEAPSPLQHAPAIHSQALLDQLRASSGTSRRFVGRSLVEASGN